MKLHQSSILFLTLLFSIGHSAAQADEAFNQGRATDAELMALFHPFDASLSTIAAMVASATDTIDIALYNIDIGSTNPIIAALESDAVKSRLQSGSLKIRLIYEGYAEPEVNAKLMTQLENLGIDVRALASGKKLHHKFGLFDAHTDHAQIVSGSANWSLASMKHYDEAITKLSGFKHVEESYSVEFEKLWAASASFGVDRWPLANPLAGGVDASYVESETWRELSYAQEGVTVYFNSTNFTIKGKTISRKKDSDGFVLTRKLVNEISTTVAGDVIEIATTRIKLRPVFDALVAAAGRGVKIRLLVSMDSYGGKARFNEKLDPDCALADSEWEDKCSSGVKFAHFLNVPHGFPGSENVEVRIKMYHLNSKNFLSDQMHSKYMLISNRKILSGSFNWSLSAEYDHLENVMVIDGEKFPEIMQRFDDNFETVYTRGRDGYADFVSKVENALRTHSKISCKFDPIAMTFSEMDYLLAAESRIKKETGDKQIKLLDICI